jgi:hypothetical protein
MGWSGTEECENAKRENAKLLRKHDEMSNVSNSFDTIGDSLSLLVCD